MNKKFELIFVVPRDQNFNTVSENELFVHTAIQNLHSNKLSDGLSYN